MGSKFNNRSSIKLFLFKKLKKTSKICAFSDISCILSQGCMYVSNSHLCRWSTVILYWNKSSQKIKSYSKLLLILIYSRDISDVHHQFLILLKLFIVTSSSVSWKTFKFCWKNSFRSDNCSLNWLAKEGRKRLKPTLLTTAANMRTRICWDRPVIVLVHTTRKCTQPNDSICVL